MVFLLSFLVMSISLVSFSGVASAHKKEHCKVSAKTIEVFETGAGFGGFTIHAKCLTPSAFFVVTSNLPPGCPSVIAGAAAVTRVGLGGHIDAFATFGPSPLCIPGDYTIAIVEQDPDDPGLIATIPFEIDCCKG